MVSITSPTHHVHLLQTLLNLINLKRLKKNTLKTSEKLWIWELNYVYLQQLPKFDNLIKNRSKRDLVIIAPHMSFFLLTPYIIQCCIFSDFTYDSKVHSVFLSNAVKLVPYYTAWDFQNMRLRIQGSLNLPSHTVKTWTVSYYRRQRKKGKKSRKISPYLALFALSPQP